MVNLREILWVSILQQGVCSSYREGSDDRLKGMKTGDSCGERFRSNGIRKLPTPYLSSYHICFPTNSRAPVSTVNHENNTRFKIH